MVHHYITKDGFEACKYCGKVRNKDRTWPELCSGRLPPIETRRGTP